MRFGSTLKLLRLDAGLSVRALARQIGVSSAYLSRVENGRDPAPTPERLRAIADVLELPRDMLVELAHQTAPALSDYLQRVPAASAFFLDVARRDLDASQLARLRAVMDREFPPSDVRSEAVTPLRSLIEDRIVVGLRSSTMDEVIDVGAERCVSGTEARAEDVARRVREREAVSPTILGGGVAVPHAVVPNARSSATLVTLAEPLRYGSGGDTLVEVVVVLISAAAGRAHLEALAQVARLASHGVAGKLRTARTPAHARAAIEQFEGA